MKIYDLVGEVNKEIKNHHKVLITTLTKKMAEDLTDYMRELGIRVKYLHSDIDTLERAEIIRDLRLDVFDVLVGINLLREGLDIPEITLVAILDADKEGFLRSETSLIQTIGRAARNSEGHVIMYADTITDSMRVAIEETERRQRNGNRCRRAVAFGICLIQKRHALEIFLTDLHHDGQQLLHAPILADSKKRLCEEIVHRIIGIAQHQGMMRIGRHAAHPEQNQGFQAADILLRIPEIRHIVIGSATARSSTVRTVGHKPCLFRMYAVNQLAQCLFVEAYICNGGK